MLLLSKRNRQLRPQIIQMFNFCTRRTTERFTSVLIDACLRFHHMGKGKRANLEDLLRSTWVRQHRLLTSEDSRNSMAYTMPDTPDNHSALSLGDKLAITVGCLGGAVVIITYLIPKTPFFTGVLLTFLTMFICYPLLHFVKSLKVKTPSVLIVFALVFLFGKKVWLKTNQRQTS